MSLITVIAAFQTKHLTIAGIVAAPTALPASLNTADLPFVWTLPGPATWSAQAAGLKRHSRDYIVRVYVEPLGQQILDETYQRILTFIQLFADAYYADVTLGNVLAHLGDDSKGQFEDSGVTTLEYAGHQYRGVEFTVPAVEKVTA